MIENITLLKTDKEFRTKILPRELSNCAKVNINAFKLFKKRRI